MVNYYGEKPVKTKRGQGRSSSATREELDNMSANSIRKILETASYVVPAGMGVNALRLAYKAYTAGKKAIGLAKTGQKTVQAASQARKNKLITAGEQRAINREAALKAQQAANRANAAKTKAYKAENRAVGATVAGTAAALSLKSKSKTTNTTNTKPKKPDYYVDKVPSSPNTRSGNTSPTITKPKVAPKPDFKDTTPKKKKKYGESGMGMDAYQRRTGSKR
jgi:hypothetical protein